MKSLADSQLDEQTQAQPDAGAAAECDSGADVARNAAAKRPLPGGAGRGSGIDMTEGSIARLLIRFALPLLLGNVFQQTYSIIDGIVVGNFARNPVLCQAAVGASSQITNMLTSLFNGIGVGATIVIAQRYGARDKEGIKRAIDTIMAAVVVVAVPLMVIGYVAAGPLMRLLDMPADAMADSITFMRVIFLGILASLGYNIISGIFQGIGDTRRPLYFLMFANVLNIVLDLITVIGFHLDVLGVAISTVTAQYSILILSILYINRKKLFFKISFRKIMFDLASLKDSVVIGLPAGLQNMVFSAGTLVIQSLINSYGDAFIAGATNASKIDVLSFMPNVCFASAVTTFVGQNIGAGKFDRINKGIRTGMWMSIVLSIALAVIILPVAPFVLGLFNPDKQVVTYGLDYLHRAMPFYWVNSIVFIFNSALRGMGSSIVPMASSMISLWIARVPLAYVFANLFGGPNLYLSYVFGWLIGIAISGGYYATGKWKKIARRRFEMAQAAAKKDAEAKEAADTG